MRLAALALLAACSSTPETGIAVVTSDSGMLVADVFVSPTRGVNTMKLHITDHAGHPMDGLAMTVTPWMPSHAHGTSVIPIVTASGNGDYVVTELELFMPGRWQMRVAITAPMTDSLMPVLDVP